MNLVFSDTDPAQALGRSRIEIINIDPERPSTLSALDESLLSRISILYRVGRGSRGILRGEIEIREVPPARFLPPERESKSLGQIKIVGHTRGQLAFDGRANGHGSSSPTL